MNAIHDSVQGNVRMNTLSVVLIGPDDSRRRALAKAFLAQQVTIAGELGSYPNFNNLIKLTESDCDVVVVDLDGDVDMALDLVENICTRNSALTVMVSSSSQEPELLVRCMRAGARELLSEPVTAAVLVDAIVRASARRLEFERQKRTTGKVLVFRGAKGGAGATTVASNFAIALRKESGQEVALVDLNLELGDLGVALGLRSEFSVRDALSNPRRLDQDFVSTLLSEHESGVKVLTASDEYGTFAEVEASTLGKLLYILRDRFPYVVVDVGPSLGLAGGILYEMADLVYLVMQVDIPTLRNAKRIISHIQGTADNVSRVEVVLNRYEPRTLEIEEHQIAKALALPLKWKIPNDYSAVRRSLDVGEALASGNSPVAQALSRMARAACGKPQDSEKKKRRPWFG